jgi:hypothetical protein
LIAKHNGMFKIQIPIASQVRKIKTIKKHANYIDLLSFLSQYLFYISLSDDKVEFYPSRKAGGFSDIVISYFISNNAANNLHKFVN